MDYRKETPMSYSAREAGVTYDEGLRAYLLHIYNYMASALALTGITAYLGSHWEPLINALYTMHGARLGLSGLGYLVLFAPLIMVMVLGAGVNRMSLPALQGTFWAFAGIMGLSLSSIFFVYTGQSIVQAFFVTAITFGCVSMFGYATKRDLTGMGHFLMMGLFGIIIASLVNFFLGSAAIQFAVSVLGIAIFTGLTAYDTQKMKTLYYQTSGSGEIAGKAAIMGALNLYLDFINMFLMMLRLFGNRR